MIGIAQTLPGLAETPPTVGMVKKLVAGGTFAQSFEGFRLPKNMESVTAKRPAVLAKSQAPAEEQQAVTLTAEAKQPTGKAVAAEGTIPQPSVKVPVEPASSITSTPLAQSKLSVNQAKTSSSARGISAPAQPVEVESAASELDAPQQASLARPGLSLTTIKANVLNPVTFQASGNQADASPQVISTRVQAKQDKAKPLEKTAARSTTSMPDAPSVALAPQTPILASSSAPTVAAASVFAQAPPPATPSVQPPLQATTSELPLVLAAPTQPGQAIPALEAKTTRESKVAVALPTVQPLKAASTTPIKKASLVAGASVPAATLLEPAQPLQIPPAHEGKTISDSQQNTASPEPISPLAEAAAQSVTTQVATSMPEAAVPMAKFESPPQAISTPPAVKEKPVRNDQALTPAKPNTQSVEVADSNPPAQAEAAPTEASIPLMPSGIAVQVTSRGATTIVQAPVAASRAPSAIDKKAPAVTVNRNAVAVPTQSDPVGRTLGVQDTLPQQGHTRNTLHTEHTFSVDKSSPPVLPTSTSSPEIAPLLTKVQEAGKGDIVSANSRPSLAMEGFNQAASSTPSLAHTILQATPTMLEVGVPAGTQGWLKIRAEMGEGGAVQASISAATKSGQEMLHHDLPAMKAFLDAEQLPVTLQVTHASAAVISSGTSRIIMDTATIVAGSTPSSHDASGLIGSGQQHGGMSDQASRQRDSRPGPTSEHETFHREMDESPRPITMGFDGSLRGGGNWLNVMA